MNRSRAVRSRASRLFACVAASMLSLLLVPMTAFASTQISVEGTSYDKAASGHGSGGGTWEWDGADAFGMADYVDGRITANGALDITLTGENVIDYDASRDGGNTALVTGYDEGGTLTVEGDGSLTVNATASEGDVLYGVYSYGDLAVENTSVEVNVTSDGDETSAVGTASSGATRIDGSSVSVSAQGPGGSMGMTANEGFEANGSQVDVRVDATAGSPGFANGINTIGLSIANGSEVNVEVEAAGDAAGIFSFSSDRFVIADSTVRATAASSEGLGVGLRAENMEEGGTVNLIMRHANVQASGSTAAIWAYGQVPGSRITLERSAVVAPAGGAPQAIEVETDRFKMTYGQVIGTGVGTITSLDDPAVAKAVEVRAVDPTPTPTPTPVPPTPQPSPTPASSGGSGAILPATGDAAPGALALAGVLAAALAAGALLAVRTVARRRSGSLR